jgi:hypothetical protein
MSITPSHIASGNISRNHYSDATVAITSATANAFAAISLHTVEVDTTEVATIGLGQKFGTGVLIFGNIFAILAMSAGFIGSGTALRQNFVWDNKMNPFLAELAVVSIPLLLFILGLRQFISILSVAGGLVIGTEALLLVLVCWQARKKKRNKNRRILIASFLVIGSANFFDFYFVYS